LSKAPRNLVHWHPRPKKGKSSGREAKIKGFRNGKRLVPKKERRGPPKKKKSRWYKMKGKKKKFVKEMVQSQWGGGGHAKSTMCGLGKKNKARN